MVGEDFVQCTPISKKNFKNGTFDYLAVFVVLIKILH
jgi:hypothetical protein